MKSFLKQFLFHKQFQELSVYGFGQLFNLVTPLLVVPHIVAVCGEENFGKTAVGMAVAFFLIVFIDFGSDIIGVRQAAINRYKPESLNRVFTTTYIVKAVILFIVVALTSFAIAFFPFFKSEKTMFYFGLTVLIGQFINPTWFLQGIENVKDITVINIISKSIYLIGIYTTINQEADYIYINLWWGTGMIIANSIIFIKILKKHSFNFLKVTKTEVLQHFKNDFVMFSSQIFVSLQLYAPIVLISSLGGNLMAGQYRIIEQIIVVFKTYIFLFFNFVFPKICYLIAIDHKKAMQNWTIYNGANFVFVFISMVVLHYFSYPIVSYFNPTNRDVLSSLLHVAVFVPLLLAISIPLKQLILAYNYKQFYAALTTIIVLVNLIAIYVLLPIYQVYGVFYSLIATDFIIIIFYIYKLKNKWIQA